MLQGDVVEYYKFKERDWYAAGREKGTKSLFLRDKYFPVNGLVGR